jgi:hypothetical protein
MTHRPLRQLEVIVAALSVAACSPTTSATRDQQTADSMEASPKSIGEASMEEDGTIVLRLRAESDAGVIGDGFVRYPPDHEEYARVLDHLGGLEPGESKPVPRWRDPD